MLKTTPSSMALHNVVDQYDEIKQQMAAISTDKVGLKNGNYPFVIDEQFLDGGVTLPSGESVVSKLPH